MIPHPCRPSEAGFDRRGYACRLSDSNRSAPRVSHLNTPRLLSLTAVLFAGLAGLVASGLGFAPEPSPVPTRWEIAIEVGPLRIIKINVPDKGPRAFLYMSYKATNNSGQDLLFAPSFELVGADGRIVRSGRDVPAVVTKDLLERANNPFLQDQIGIIGPIQRGIENAKEGLVVFSAESLNPGEIAVFAAGFSGEMATVAPPTGGERVILRKTRMLRYSDGGDLTGRGERPLDPIEARWIMR